MLVATAVLDDCIRAHNSLDDEEHDPNIWRVKWIGALALIRMVGHVLHKVDGANPKIRTASEQLYKEWNDPRSEHLIFTDFIEKQRNEALKTYEVGVSQESEISLFVEDDGMIEGTYSLPADLFRPLENGPFAGEDARDIYLQAIYWWREQLERVATEVGH